MAHQPGMGRGVGPAGKPYNFETVHQTDQHMQARMQSPRSEHFPPTSPIFTGTPTLPGPVTPSCTTPPMGTTSIPRYPLRSPTHPMYPGDQHRVSPVSTRNVIDPSLQMHYQYPPYYHGRRASYSEEQPITSSPGGTHHLPGYPTGVISQQMTNVPPYPTQNIPKRPQSVKSGTRRNPGLQIDFSPSKGTEMGYEGYPPTSSPYPPPMLRSPAYPVMSTVPGNASDEVKELRRKVVEYFYQNIEILRKRYQLSLQELFFLQHGGNLIDFPLWRRRPTPQWIAYQATHKLEDEIDFFVMSNPMENAQIQNVGSEYIALQHKFYPGSIGSGNAQQDKMLSASGLGFGNTQRAQNPHASTNVPSNPIGGHIDLSSSKLFMSKDTNFGPALDRQLSRGGSSSNPQSDLANARALAFNNSKEDIMLEAKREADILKRVAELRKEGLWSAKRLPKVQEPSRNKSHWDYVLEEMAWLATDFAQERRWKKGVAKKLSKAVLRYHQEIKTKEVKAEKESTVRLQKIASSIAKEVRQFWVNVEKVVQYKIQSRIEEKRKKALDVHLNFIVGQTEKYSSWLAESLKESKPSSSVASSVASSTAASSPVSSRQEDTGEESDLNISDESDDEETIDVEESYETKEFNSAEDEISVLQRESEIPIDDLLESLPLEMFTEHKAESDLRGSDSDDEVDDDNRDEDDDNTQEKNVEARKSMDDQPSTSSAKREVEKMSVDEGENDGDDEFVLRETMVDVDDEGTLDEEEKMEEKDDHVDEISQLEEEGELPIEELLKKYNVGNEDDADEVHRDEESEESYDEDSSEEDEGMEFLLQSDTAQEKEAKTNTHSESPNQELTDAAATAESLQPTGYTLETTQVKTPIPFLLRGGTLREYQYIGLDWLVTMYEKCLNGILADEMGLGKTIMTIAVLAHLACERGSWGPHLIVVPTSVMLNWEMEFKKWCPGFKILTYYGNQKERKIKRTGWTKPNAFHVCITSYKLVVQDHQSFRRKKWKYLILDEAQNIKNFKSQRWQYLLNFNTERRLLLTGTPLQNNLMELWSLMHFLMPHLFESHKDFKDWFSNPLSGMIEGSSEYNENLVKRLHKVLRPFLLRRLKSEVEKQMPQKYEHVIRCRLSKRQRVLYDDFMSQTRTKETLESGHLLSVINILMQLRKVCNHPDLFEPRPTVTSLKMSCIVYTTASLVLTALDKNPLNTLNLHTMNLLLTQLEFTLSAFASHRVIQLQTPQALITEIDCYTPPETPLLFPLKSELNTQSHNGHLINHTKPNGPLGFQRPSSGITLGGYKKGTTPIYPEAETLCPGYAGQRYTPPTEQDSYNAFNSTENTANTYTTVGASMFGEVRNSDLSTPLGQVTGEVKTVGNLPYNTRTLLKASRTLNTNEVRAYGNMNGHVNVNSTTMLEQRKLLTEKTTEGTSNKGLSLNSSPFTLPRLEEKRFHERQSKLRFLAGMNERRCAAQPVYGQDLVQSVTVLKNPLERTWCKISSHRPSVCETLQSMTKSPQERIDELRETIKRFVFAIPAVTSQRIHMHTCHPPPFYVTRQKQIEEHLQCQLSDKMDILHPIIRGKLLQFPEVRLIQYDCGKLQTLDLLLRRLKAEKHRVLIFTQMTKMLNVLERFLNYHGYLYLRLDGTTRVEQRQVLMERFNNDKKIFCFILSTRSGGVGVNLTGADTVIFYDSDWNPTMDAQAQDRCHRIGQTQDVHIYRLISEKTIEENILKKAHQKRLLGEIAIEGGNFTTTVLRETTVRDLFSVNENDSDFQEMVAVEKNVEEQPAKKNPKSQNAFEEALMKAEDEQDVKAASLLKAEQDAELAEFNESIPLDDEISNGQNISKVEEELRELESQLSGVERYAVHFLESTQNFGNEEEQEIDEKNIELSKKDWELAHIQTMKEEEERRAGAEDLDENVQVTYTTEESRQEFVDEVTGEEMPLWRPPTPPCDDKEDVYVDHTQNYVYESTPLPEVQLPREKRTRRYLGDYKKHGKQSSVSFRLPYKDSVRRRLRKPHSMFDRRALEAFFKSRRDERKMKMTKQQQQQPQQQHPVSARMRQQADMTMVDTGPEWFVHEDWALLQAVHYLQEMPIDLTVTNLGHTPNWLLVSDIVNATSRTYRTARQCRDRYVNVVMPREEGKIPLIDESQKKMKTKLKGSCPLPDHSAIAGSQPLPKSKDGTGTKLYGVQTLDGGRSSTSHHSSLFELVKKTSVKRKPSVKQSLSNEPYQKSAGQTSSTLSNVNVEDVYLDPARIAAMKMERIQKEKAEALRQQQQQQQQQQQKQQQQSAQEQQPAQQAQEPAHTLSQLPATTDTKITVSQAQQPAAAGQQQAQTVPGYPIQRLTAHSQILTTTNQKISTAQMTGTLTTKPTANIQGTTTLQGTLVKGPAGSSIVVKTPPGNVAGHFAAINKRMTAHSGSPAANLATMKTAVTSESGNRVIPPHETAVQFLASTANGNIRLSNTLLASSNSAVVSQAKPGQRLPESVHSAAQIVQGKAFVHTGTKPSVSQQYNLIQKRIVLDNVQQQRRQQQGQQPIQQQQAQQQQGKQVVQHTVRKVASPAPQKHLPVGTKVGQQRVAQTMTVTRPVQQQQLQQGATQTQPTQQQLQQLLQHKQQSKQPVQQTQPKQATQAATAQQAKQTPKQQERQVVSQVTNPQQQPVTTQQIKRVQIAPGQQVTSGIVTQAGIVTTSGHGGTAKHLVKLLPGQTLSSIAHKLTPQQHQAYRITLLKQQQQQQQQRLQQQSQQQSSQQIQQRRQQQTSQPGQTQPSTTTIETAPKSASPGVQSQQQTPPTTQIQLVTLQQPGVTTTNLAQPKQPLNKPATTVAGQQMTSPPATPSSAVASTVASTTPTSTQGAQSGNLANQHQSPYAMRSRSQSK